MDLSSTCSIWPSKNVFELSDTLPKGASLFWLLSTLTAPETDGLITNISVIQTWRWFFALTPFEAVFLAMIMLHILTLQVLGILPLNVNQLVHGMSSGRKKRGIGATQCIHNINHEVSGQILNIIQRVDKYGCIFRTLCEAQKQSYLRVKLPDSILLTLATLSSSNGCAKMDVPSPSSSKSLDDEAATNKLLLLYQESVDLGEMSSHSRNTTHCEDRYRDCPLGVDEILSYLHQMRLDDMF